MQQNLNKKRKGLTPCEPSRIQATREALNRQEWGKLFAVCTSPHFRKKAPYLAPVVALGTFAGLRIVEIVALRWDDIDTTNGIIEVRHSKTKAGVRVIPLHPIVADVLKQPVCRQIPQLNIEPP
jgi:integrase